MADLKTVKLKVERKFSAPAELYVPSKRSGGGWIEISGPKMGGEAIIQIQCGVAVVRFLFRHKKDFLNTRIQPDLPIHRKGRRTVIFKSVTSSTSGLRMRKVYCLRFETKDDTDDFVMWWLAKSGSTSLLLKTKSPKKAMKRKAERCSSEDDHKKKRSKMKSPSTSTPPPHEEQIKGGKKSVDGDSDAEEEVLVDDYDAPMSQKWTDAFSFDESEVSDEE